MGTQELRRYPRVVIDVPVQIEGPDGPLLCELQNLSGGGLCVRGENFPPLGTALRVLIRLPAARPVSCRGLAIWARDDDAGAVMGVRLDDLSDDDRRNLMNYLARLDPIYSDAFDPARLRREDTPA